MAEVQRRESGLVVEERGHVRVLTLDRPERRNALSSALQADLVEELLRCGEDGDVRAVVLAANGPAFCAGFDLTEIREQDLRGERFRPPMNRPTRALFEVVTETPRRGSPWGCPRRRSAWAPTSGPWSCPSASRWASRWSCSTPAST